jgi:transposase
MDRAELGRLPREELIELVLRLQELVGALRRQVEALRGLEARVAELEAAAAAARPSAPPKTPDNSSVPPSQGFQANRAARRQRTRGPKRGHVGRGRHRQVPDVIVRCRPEQCAGCGAALPAAGQRRVGRSQVVEVVPARAVVVEAWRYAARCAACGVRTVAAAPAGLEATRTFGPEIEALLAYFHERHHLSYARLVEVCDQVLGLRLSQGAVANALARVAERARPRYAAIGAAVRASPVIGSDETRARVDGQTWWQWVFQSAQASYHVLAPTRAATVIDAFLAGTEPPVWIADLYAAQVGTAAGVYQVCLAHQIRDLTYAVEADDLEGRVWAVALRHLFGRAIRLHHEREQIAPASFSRRRTRVLTAAQRLIFGPPLGHGPAWALQQRYRRHWDALFVFLDRTDVAPTNNASERDLRNSVIHRKVTGGYRSRWGAEASAIFTSILTTARKQGDNLLDALRTVTSPAPQLVHDMAT